MPVQLLEMLNCLYQMKNYLWDKFFGALAMICYDGPYRLNKNYCRNNIQLLHLMAYCILDGLILGMQIFVCNIFPG